MLIELFLLCPSPQLTLPVLTCLQQLHAKEKDFVSACGLLGVGVEFTRISGAGYTQILFLLSKAMVRAQQQLGRLGTERRVTEGADAFGKGDDIMVVVFYCRSANRTLPELNAMSLLSAVV